LAETGDTAWAFVTPSYSGDHRRCCLLSRSMDAFVSGNWTHYIVVDQPDFEMFRHLNGPRRRVLLTHEVLPGNMRRLFQMPFLGGRSVWWSKSTGLSIGWHLQQMVKIGIASTVAEDGLAYCDSDTFFVRPFDVASLTPHGRFRLYRTYHKAHPSQAPNPEYTRAGLEMLGLPKDGIYYSYVENFVTWRRQSVLALQQHLAQRNGGEWRRAFRNRLQVSEYNLYGLFVDNIENQNELREPASYTLCKTQWHREALSEEKAVAFCGDLLPEQVMIGIQSFAGVDMGILERQFEQALKREAKA
jgi:Family of unknown function (DUF6492)